MASSAALRFSFHAARRSVPTFFVGQSSSKLAPTSLSSLRRRFLSYPAHELVGMPSLSPTMEAGTIATWKVKEGDSFIAGDSFCTVETDKATMDFEAQDEGVVAKILAPAGSQEIKCGEPILITVSSEADVAAFANYSVSASAPAAAAAAPVPPAPAAAAPAPVAPPPPAAAPKPVAPVATGGRVVASPLAFLLAKELGHDISAIVGTGPGGRVIAADVKEYVPAAAPAVETPAAAAPTAVAATTAAPAQAVFATAAPVIGAGYTDFPLSESAREIAARLTLSKQRVPHYYLTVDINMDKILELRSTLNAGIGKGPQLGVYELVLKAAAASMKTVPSVNASWMDSVVRVYDSVDINVVVGNGDALYTPVIRDCGSLGVKSISDALSKAVASLEGGSEEALGSEFSAMGTFTVMNLGIYGIKSCAPIIREPQSCALALGAIENRIVPNDGGDDIYKQSTVMTATLSCDHRVVDGAVGAQWLSAFKAHIENPTTLLL